MHSLLLSRMLAKTTYGESVHVYSFLCSEHAPNHRSVLIFLCRYPILHACTEGHKLWWSLWEHWHGTVINRPLSWPLAFFGLKLHHLQGRPIGANSFMANAFEKALSPNHCCHSIVTCVPEQRRVSMLVYYIVNLSRRPGTLGVSFLWELLFIPCITEVRRYVNDGLRFKCVLVCVCA